MLDLDLKNQLQEVFQKLDDNIQLVLKKSLHVDQTELQKLLTDVCGTNPHLKLKESADPSPHGDLCPYFEIHNKNGFTGISFAGIPTGHEFTSLILAILNSNHKGKWPDAKTVERIKNLKGPINLRTYISLTCENCPEVVQALNLMSLINSDIKHEMADGQYFQKEIDSLGIMGVPTLVGNNQIIHSGRSQLLNLIEKLEVTYGTKDSHLSSLEPQDLGQFDVLVIGGGPAGASSAIYTVRKGLKTALIAEKLGGQVSETRGIENLISVPYTEGPALSQALLQHMNHYPIQIIEQQRVKAISELSNKKFDYKKVELESGDYLSAKAIIIATGAKWRELGIPGEKEYMGRGVAYCPHCDGPFYKGKTVAVVGGGNSGVEAAIDLAGIVEKVILLEYNDQLKADQILVDKLKSLFNVEIKTAIQSKAIVGDDKKISGLVYLDRKTQEEKQLPLDGIFIQIGLIPNSQFIKNKVETNQYGEIIIDNKCRTQTPGIYGAGDVTTVPYKQIIISMGEGAKAGLSAFEDLTMGRHD